MTLPSSKSQIIIKNRPLRLLVEQLEHPTTLLKKEKQVVIDVDGMRRSMKKSWRGGDGGNKQFGKLDVLKNKMLSSWEIQRMGLSKRSYSTPKESKGYRYDATPKEFTIKDEMALHSKPFQQLLSKIQEENENRMYKVDQNCHKKSEVLGKLSTTGMRFGKTSNFFGSSKGDGFRTLKSFKSQVGIKSKF